MDGQRNTCSRNIPCWTSRARYWASYATFLVWVQTNFKSYYRKQEFAIRIPYKLLCAAPGDDCVGKQGNTAASVRHFMDLDNPVPPHTITQPLCKPSSGQVLFHRQICNTVCLPRAVGSSTRRQQSARFLSVRHLITMQMTQFFLEAMVDQITESKTKL